MSSVKKPTAKTRKLAAQKEEEKVVSPKKTKKLIKPKFSSTHLKPIIESADAQLREYVEIFQTSEQDEVDELLARFEDTYYNSIPLISDEHYELFIKHYESRFDQKYERVIAVPDTDKFTLPYYLGSLDKIKTEKELTNWVKKYQSKKSVDVVVMDKLDGMSSLLIVKDGKSSLYTQGNHIVGRDISHLLPYIQVKIPKIDGEFRGELEISKKDFERQREKELKMDGNTNKWDSGRAMIAGIINSKKHFDANKARLVQFVSYRHFTPETVKKSSQLQKIEKLGMKTPWNCRYNLDNLTIPVLTQLVADRKKDGEFEVDGLVLVIDQNIPYPPDKDHKEPKHAIAFKADSPEAETTVLKVEWNCSKYGQFKPKIYIKPVFLSGANLGKATCHDAKHIVQMGINVGAVITVTRSNEVIPYITGVKVPKEPSYPPGKEGRDWEWNETRVNICQIKKNPDDMVIGSDEDDDDGKSAAFTEQMEIKKIYSFFKHLDAPNLGEKTVAKLYKGGLNTIPAILNATVADLCKLDGFQKRGSTNIVNGIIKAIDDSTLLTIMVASGSFGMGLGSRKIESILEKHPDIILNPLSTKELIASIKELDGFQTKTATKFASNLATFMEFLKTVPTIHERLKKESKLNLDEKKYSSDDGSNEYSTDESEKEYHALHGKLICISGFRDKELVKHLKELGAKETTSMSKKNSPNTILVLKSKGKNNTKELTAKELDIAVMELEEFLTEYKITSFLQKYGFDE